MQKNNFVLQSKSGIIGENNSGIILSTVELISNLAKHILTHKFIKGSISYFSPKIQNEIINLTGEKVQKEIVKLG